MLKVTSKKGFEESCRILDESLKRLKLKDIEIVEGERLIRYNFICDRTVVQEVYDKLLNYVFSQTPPSFTSVEVTVKKIVADKELVSLHVYNFIRDNYPSLCLDFGVEDVSSYTVGEKVVYKIKVIESNKLQFESNNLLNYITNDLEKNFCESFKGELEVKEGKTDFSLESTSVSLADVERIRRRTIKVKNVAVIDDDEKEDVALYIEDAQSEGEVTLCGNILSIREKETKNGKPFFIIDFSDTTGKIGGIYFTKKNTIEKIKSLEVGQGIIVKGNLSYYKDKLSLTINKINACTFPKDFVAEQKVGRAEPVSYVKVFPEPMEAVKEETIFNMNERLPQELLKSTFVVFDLETTGTEPTIDAITEIGAVKIENGVITTKFQTLINPERRISAEITKLTGIDDEMVKNAPTFGEVVADFYKFTRNTVMVGHNVDFDKKFIQFHGAPYEYYFENQYEDTCQMARELIFGLSNYKLNTVGDYFGVKFLHHRALSDAHATAQIFIELLKIKEDKK